MKLLGYIDTKGLKCSICRLSVRGLGMVCINCGHGGHTKHITDWFVKYKCCPLGCGCNCIFDVFTIPTHFEKEYTTLIKKKTTSAHNLQSTISQIQQESRGIPKSTSSTALSSLAQLFSFGFNK